MTTTTTRRYEVERISRLRKRKRESPARKRLIAELVRRDAEATAAETGEAAPTWSTPLPPSRWQRFKLWQAERRDERAKRDREDHERDRRDGLDPSGIDDFLRALIMMIGGLLQALAGAVAVLIAAPAVLVYRVIERHFVDEARQRSWPVRSIGAAGISATVVALIVWWRYVNAARGSVRLVPHSWGSLPQGWPSWWPVVVIAVVIAAATVGAAGYALAAGWSVQPIDAAQPGERRKLRRDVRRLPPMRLTVFHRSVLDGVHR